MTSSLNTMSDEQLRAIALDHATKTAWGGASADEIAKAAETYYGFLTGHTDQAEGAVAEPRETHVHVVNLRGALRDDDTEREQGEPGRRKRLVRSIVRDLRKIGQLAAAERVEVVYGETR